MTPVLPQPAPGRDLLLACSLVLACAGLLPLLEFASAPPPVAHSSISAMQDTAAALGALALADRSALLLSGALAALGLALLLLQLAPPLSAASTLQALRVALLGVGCAVVATAAVLMLQLQMAEDDSGVRPSVWHSEQFAASELAFEQQVNDLFCTAKGRDVCAFGSIADARQVFPLAQWPVGSDSHPGRRVVASCDRLALGVHQWGYPVKMELCRVCADIREHGEQLDEAWSRRYSTGVQDPVAQLQQVVPRLSIAELMWCGDYLTQRSTSSSDPTEDLSHKPKLSADQSPYRAHREAFRDLLGFDNVPTGSSLHTVRRVMQVLLVAGVGCGWAIRKWASELEKRSTSKFASHE